MVSVQQRMAAKDATEGCSTSTIPRVPVRARFISSAVRTVVAVPVPSMVMVRVGLAPLESVNWNCQPAPGWQPVGVSSVGFARAYWCGHCSRLHWPPVWSRLLRFSFPGTTE